MGGRKRQKSQGSPGKSNKRSNKGAKEETKKPVDKEASDDEPSLKKLFDKCFVSGSKRDQKFSIKKSSDRGLLEKVVWPCVTSSSDDDEDLLKASQLAAAFVAHRCWEGSFRASTMLQIMDDADTVNKMLDALLYKSDASNTVLNEIIVHFVVAILSGDNKLLQESIQPHITGVELWHHMPKHRLELELKKRAGLRRKFQQTKKRDIWIISTVQSVLKILSKETAATAEPDDDDDKDESMDVADDSAAISKEEFLFVHRALELMIDLLSASSTRKFLVTYLDSIHFAIQSKQTFKATDAELSENARLSKQALGLVAELLNFPIHEHGKAHLSKFQVVSKHHARAIILQKLAHRHYPHALQQVVFAGVSLLCAPNTKDSFLERSLAALTDEQFADLLARMCLITKGGDQALTKDYMQQVLGEYLAIPSYPADKLKSFPLYPTEAILWDHNIIPPSSKALRLHSVLSVPKLDRRFLSYQDYLLRNFELVRLESSYEIRSDIVQVLQRLRPMLRQDNNSDPDEAKRITEFNGWSPMAIEIAKPLKITDVQAPKIGETVTSRVIAQFEVDLKLFSDKIKQEWDELFEFENLFLINVDASKMSRQPQPTLNEFYAEHSKDLVTKQKYGNKKVPADEDSTFPARMGLQTIRGCMVLEIKDEAGTVLSDPSERHSGAKPKGSKRIFKVALDPAQYDLDRKSPAGTDIYHGFNILMRRHGRENNFKPMLECIKGLLEGSGSIDRVIPEWLYRVFLGQEDPTGAQYSSDKMKKYAEKTVGVSTQTDYLDFRDTFLDKEHLKESFKESISVDGGSKKSACNYKVRVSPKDSNKLEAKATAVEGNAKANTVRYTPAQVEAIRSGLSPGLTLCVGPPGTGKTDVAVQIIACLFHTYPTQRTVIVTHSNAALNDIFNKVMARGDIDEKYLLRLGSGEKDLQVDSTHDFTKLGRVNYSLQRRSKLLEKVQLLSESLGVSSKADRGADGASAYTCESAEYFRKQHVEKHIKQVEEAIDNLGKSSTFKGDFPFAPFFNLEADDSMKKSKVAQLLSEIKDIFEELTQYRPYELLRSQRQRSNFLILKQARIVAMTCTHASIVRSQLVELGFEYDNIIMEESAQMTEIETFIPLLLQKGETDESVAGKSRLKRICMLGDHHQLPPVVKNACLAKFSNFDQSLFTRLIRNGVPHIQLDKQGRARPSLASLYSWRYEQLGNLKHVNDRKDYQLANAGLANTCQIINVDDFHGRGESAPMPYFYQNVGEAEYIVAFFQYMVLIGYPASKISIITTYNGQKDLLTDVMSQRCGPGTPFAGMKPRAISTVDQYQGQQNDFILLSLVRTSSVGHLRDIRRLVVAVSRARLGLYVFCRSNLFGDCHELRQTFDQLVSKPTKLQLVLGENYGAIDRKAEEDIPEDKVFEVADVGHMGSIVHSMAADWVGGGK